MSVITERAPMMGQHIDRPTEGVLASREMLYALHAGAQFDRRCGQ